ncbi:hypothetical protein BJF93_19135 [Xaviernesmea oryzae]|uniref:Replication protein C n=1 Tax=Xaviernesmea oryzae TaxID=464029 RepID=A0A1Q9B1D3_9HYPH|nr:plasmid replication protein RepC [Xaviernesmea oryzae]OLP61810.1 hypothetical protein BJF93_19135 [Xaviernesmea oryzae]SEL76685.1 replication initiation protein RepC [Xaviernesmea oryzae]
MDMAIEHQTELRAQGLSRSARGIGGQSFSPRNRAEALAALIPARFAPKTDVPQDSEPKRASGASKVRPAVSSGPGGPARPPMSALARARGVAVQRQARKGALDPIRPDKWQLLRALTEARVQFDLSDRSLLVLEALISFHPERQIDGQHPAIVFPSNAELILRARGMAPATLRRHLASLVAAGMVLRRDSPNGKRYCRRGRGGQGDQSFGFDLAAFARRAPEIIDAARLAGEQSEAHRQCRTEITLHLRAVAGMLARPLEQGSTPSLWTMLKDRLTALSGRVSRTAPLGRLEARRDALSRLRAEVETAYLRDEKRSEMSANDAQNEHHIETPESDDLLNAKPEQPARVAKGEAAAADPSLAPAKDETVPILEDGPPCTARNAETGDKSARSAMHRRQQPVSHPVTAQCPAPDLRDLARLCPDFCAYAPNGLRSAGDAMRTADLVRRMFAISDSAWHEARHVFGWDGVIMIMAAITQRAEAIRSPGGYLRQLTMKAKKGQFRATSLLLAVKQSSHA